MDTMYHHVVYEAKDNQQAAMILRCIAKRRKINQDTSYSFSVDGPTIQIAYYRKKLPNEVYMNAERLIEGILAALEVIDDMKQLMQDDLTCLLDQFDEPMKNGRSLTDLACQIVVDRCNQKDQPK
jgi:hypothetical protein